MGRSQNPTDVYRRAQRKKELKKNKVARIRARDEKVAQTETIESISSKITELEKKQTFQEGYLDSNDTRKLERLRKEYRIVLNEAEKRAKEEEERKRLEEEEMAKHAKTKEGVQEQNRLKYEASAKMSIYYDPLLNPFGAPPPGKPMLYHRRGGGFTMKVAEAVIPEEILKKEARAREEQAAAGDDTKKRKKRVWDEPADDTSDAHKTSGEEKRSKEVTAHSDQMSMSSLSEESSSAKKTTSGQPAIREVTTTGFQRNTPSHPPRTGEVASQTAAVPPPPPPIPPPYPPPPCGPPPMMPLPPPVHGGMPPPLPPHGPPPPHHVHSHPPPPPHVFPTQPPPPRPPYPPNGPPHPPPPPPHDYNQPHPPPPRSHPPPPLPPPHDHPPPPPPPLHPHSHPPPPPSFHYHNPPPPPPPPPNTQEEENLPPLPPPSEAVKRLERKKAKDKININTGKQKQSLSADIWASAEELQYEGDALLGPDIPSVETASERSENARGRRRKKPSKEMMEEAEKYDPCCPSAKGYSEYRNHEQILSSKSMQHQQQRQQEQHLSGHHNNRGANTRGVGVLVNRWYYIDNSSGAIQGPFTGEQMMDWVKAGFFPPTTPVRNGESGQFRPLSAVDLMAPISQTQTSSIPFAETDNETKEEDDADVEARIHALRHTDADFSTAQGPSVPRDEEEQDTAPGEVGVVDRIEAIKRERMAREKRQESGDENEINSRQKDGRDVGLIAGGDEAYPAPSDVDPQHEGNSYPVAVDEGTPSHTVAEDDVPYPVDVDYPVTGTYGVTEDIAYPVGESEGGIDDEYPAVAPYPMDGGDEGAIGGYPIADAVGPYPVDDSLNHAMHASQIEDGKGGTAEKKEFQPKKKVYKGDKAVVGFVPSHLQVRRPAKKKAGQTVASKRASSALEDSRSAFGLGPKGNRDGGSALEWKPKDKAPPSNSVADDYEKFMEEISALK